MPDANPREKFVIARTRSPARETRALPFAIRGELNYFS